MSITRALSKVNLKDSQALAIYDRLNEISQTEQKNILQITLEQDDLEVSPRLAALFLLLHLYNWFSGGGQAFFQLGVLIGDLWPESVAPEGGLEAQIVAVSLQAMEGLASIEMLDDLTGAPANQAATGLSHLARLLQREGHSEDALACALSAMNMASKLNPQTHLVLLDQALDIAPFTTSPILDEQLPILALERAILPSTSRT